MRKAKYRNRRRRQFFIVFLVVFVLVLTAAAGYVFFKGSSGTHDNGSGLNTSAASNAGNSRGAQVPTAPTVSTETSIANQKTPKPGEATDPIKEKLATMSLDEKLGQMVIVGLDGYKTDSHAVQMIKNRHVGGFILFKNNIQNSNQMLDLLNSLKKENQVNQVPLFLSVDEEGGRISRLPDEFLKFPTNQTIGQMNNSSLSYTVGSIIGEELKSFGMNMDFAPVLDINSNPQNPVIGDRSFGSEPVIVTKLGVQTMKGLQSQNIISVIKHFPGHGDTSVDSHVGLPIVNNGLQRLRSFELKPFAAAVENGAEVVMVAHILLPKIDPKNPASFSKTIISDILRRDMNYDGVVITDDFTMGAIIKNYNIGQAAVKSILAGSDIVLVCHGFDKQEEVIAALKNAAQTGKLTMNRIDQSVYRILKLKNKHNITDSPAEAVNSKAINDKIKALFK
ncbi:MAG TPA: beta-N-acetylhexosaminidase [Ruminiclostridium sp.]|nr:beta-N-acetylhexosaminidase [Ruminiclostridium sp.]